MKRMKIHKSIIKKESGSFSTFICLDCKYSGRKAICPKCNNNTYSMGKNFKTPRKTNKNQWKKLKVWTAIDNILKNISYNYRFNFDLHKLPNRTFSDAKNKLKIVKDKVKEFNIIKDILKYK